MGNKKKEDQAVSVEQLLEKNQSEIQDQTNEQSVLPDDHWQKEELIEKFPEAKEQIEIQGKYEELFAFVGSAHSTTDLSENESNACLFILLRKLKIFGEIIEALVKVKGSVIEHTGETLPDFESEQLKCALFSVVRAEFWIEYILSKKSYNYPNPTGTPEELNTLTELFGDAAAVILVHPRHEDRSELIDCLEALIYQSLGVIESIYLSGREISAARTNVFSYIYELYRFVQEEGERITMHYNYLLSLKPSDDSVYPS